MILNGFGYIVCTGVTNSPEEDAVRLLLANGKEHTARHVRGVAKEAVRIAVRFGLDERVSRMAGYLHDVSAVIRPEDMLKEALRRGMSLCEAEERHPFLLHQRMSAMVAREYFGVEDEAVLSAVECHTTLRPGATGTDMALFLADKLAWDQEGTPPFEEAVREAMNVSLEKACLVYMTFMAESGRLLCPHDNWTRALDWLRAGKAAQEG